MAVTALEIARRSLVLDGRPWGAAGAYEKLADALRVAVEYRPVAPLLMASVSAGPP